MLIKKTITEEENENNKNNRKKTKIQIEDIFLRNSKKKTK